MFLSLIFFNFSSSTENEITDIEAYYFSPMEHTSLLELIQSFLANEIYYMPTLQKTFIVYKDYFFEFFRSFLSTQEGRQVLKFFLKECLKETIGKKFFIGSMEDSSQLGLDDKIDRFLEIILYSK